MGVQKDLQISGLNAHFVSNHLCYFVVCQSVRGDKDQCAQLRAWHLCQAQPQSVQLVFVVNRKCGHDTGFLLFGGEKQIGVRFQLEKLHVIFLGLIST
jgi:hypothetical protein